MAVAQQCPFKHVKFETSIGAFEVELYTQHAPKSCFNFASLAKQNYYNDTVFHRVIKDFIVQCGDPTGTGRGGESIWGGYFEDEITPELRHTGAGIVSMANVGPNTNGSQFFITLAPTPWLDGQNTILGRISSGLQSIKRLGLVPTDKNDKPLDPIKITSATAW